MVGLVWSLVGSGSEVGARFILFAFSLFALFKNTFTVLAMVLAIILRQKAYLISQFCALSLTWLSLCGGRAVLPDTDFYIWLPNFFLPCYSGFSDIFRVLRYCAVALQFWLFVISANARKRKKTARVPTSGGVPNVVLTFGVYYSLHLQ